MMMEFVVLGHSYSFNVSVCQPVTAFISLHMSSTLG